jgi:hypothetical protein
MTRRRPVEEFLRAPFSRAANLPFEVARYRRCALVPNGVITQQQVDHVERRPGGTQQRFGKRDRDGLPDSWNPRGRPLHVVRETGSVVVTRDGGA